MRMFHTNSFLFTYMKSCGARTRYLPALVAKKIPAHQRTETEAIRDRRQISDTGRRSESSLRVFSHFLRDCLREKRGKNPMRLTSVLEGKFRKVVRELC